MSAVEKTASSGTVVVVDEPSFGKAGKVSLSLVSGSFETSITMSVDEAKAAVAALAEYLA